jgi:hypothetical protein
MHWEYMIISARVRRLDVSDLNKLGEEGWELVSFDSGGHGCYHFKRERTS